jgi:hypothetical protein
MDESSVPRPTALLLFLFYAKHATRSGIDEMHATARCAGHSFESLGVVFNFLGSEALDVEAGDRAAIEKWRHVSASSHASARLNCGKSKKLQKIAANCTNSFGNPDTGTKPVEFGFNRRRVRSAPGNFDGGQYAAVYLASKLGPVSTTFIYLLPASGPQRAGLSR